MRQLKSVVAATMFMVTMTRSHAMMNHIITAHDHIKTLKENLSEILDKKSRLTLKDHAYRLESLIKNLDALIEEVTERYNKTFDNKYTTFLRILEQLKKEAEDIHRIISKRYFFFITFMLALKSIFNKLNSEVYIQNMSNKFEILKEKLDVHEKKELNHLFATLESISSVVPSSKIKILALLRIVYNR